MKIKFSLAVAIFSVLSLGSASALADSISAEYRYGDIRDGDAVETNEYKVVYSAKVYEDVSAEFEASTKQATDEGPTSSKFSTRAVLALPELFGVKSNVKAELGSSLARNDNYNFWGYSVDASHSLYGPFSVNVGFRYRTELNGGRDEYRYNGGVTYALDSGDSLAAQYYQTRGPASVSYAGVVYTHKL